jgi:hypothetical protein
MASWGELVERLESGHGNGHSVDEALDVVLSQGRALIASIAGSDGAERVERVSRLSDDELRAVAYAAGAA